MPHRTSLYETHVRLGGRMVEFAGFELPVQYESILAEHRHTRTHTGLFDTCHMGLIRFDADAGEPLARAITVDATALAIGRGKYGFILNDAGGVIDDVILMRPTPEEFLLVVNAATADGDEAALRERLPANLAGRRLAEWGKLDVQGPESCGVLAEFVDVDLPTLKYFGCTRGTVLGTDAVISRTGYTGELGYEIFCDAEALPGLFDALLAKPNVKPAGLGARDSLRLEMGYPLYGHELNTETTPLEAGLDFAIDLARDFVGVEALRTQAERGLPRKLVALTTDQRRQFHPGAEVLSADEPVGAATSGAFSPSLNCAIGLAFIRPDLAEPGTELTIHTDRADLPAIVTPLPLYKDGTCRKKLM